MSNETDEIQRSAQLVDKTHSTFGDQTAKFGIFEFFRYRIFIIFKALLYLNEG